jgi:SPP1 gp7 family putative phage head morphogenesis protein
MSVTDGEILEWIEFAKGKPKTVKSIASKHKAHVKTALVGSIVGIPAGIALANAGKNPKDALSVNNDQMNIALTNLYGDAVPAGSSHGGVLLALGIGTLWGLASAMQSIGKDLSNITSGIGNTSLNIATSQIMQGVGNGSSADQITSDANNAITSPERLSMIATTEASRGFNAGVVEAFKANNIQQFKWINIEGVSCPECTAMAGAHDITDPIPPLHPDCLCTVEPIKNLEVSL